MHVAGNAPNLSVVVITLNEEARLPACLQSLPIGCEVIVLDSGSTDKTLEIAKTFGARIESRAFTFYAEQKNAAIDLASRSWVLSLDADEVLSMELQQAIVQTTNHPSSNGPVAYKLRRKLIFMDRMLNFGKASDEPIRLFQRGKARFHADIHERLELGQGACGILPGTLLHYSYADLSDYFRRFNSYTSKIAENHVRQGRVMPPLVLHVLRPWFEFLSRYIFRLGFLDGYPGYTYALLSALYTYVKYAKLKELEAKGR